MFPRIIIIFVQHMHTDRITGADLGGCTGCTCTPLEPEFKYSFVTTAIIIIKVMKKISNEIKRM